MCIYNKYKTTLYTTDKRINTRLSTKALEMP